MPVTTGAENAAIAAYNRAVGYHQQNDLEKAVDLYRQATAMDPGLAVAWHNCGSALEDLDDIRQAVVAYRKAIELDPDDYRSLYNLFRCHQQLGDYSGALEIFRRALPRGMNDWKLWNNLGVLFRDAEKLDQAEVCLRQALSINPGSPVVFYNLGIVAQKKGAYRQGLELYRRALAADPDYAPAKWLHDLSLPMIYENEQQIESGRNRFASNLEALAAAVRLDTPNGRQQALAGLKVTSNFFLQYQGRNDRALLSIWGNLVSRIMSANFPRFCRPRTPQLRPGKRIRIGFVSSCLYSHTVGIFLHGWLKHLDKDRFRVFLYHLGRKTDRQTVATAALAHSFRHLPEGCPKAAAAILQDDLHVLVHTDIGMNPVTTLVAAMRLAPVQCKGWGHPVTTGLPTIDYYLSSDLMEPADAQQHYTEQLIRLPNLALAWSAPQLGGLAPDRRRFGIRKDAFVFLSTQSVFKYLPRHDDIYPRIARRVPGSLFVFIEAPVKQAGAVFRKRLRRAFRSFGLEMEKYCLFVARMEHADFLRLNLSADVLLDSLEWSGGKTTLEALACGLPVVTLPGRFMRGRHAYAFLKMMGIGETIARDKQQYCRIAVRLASDRDFLERVRQKTAANHHRLCEDRLFVRELENFLHRAARKAPGGGRPESSPSAITGSVPAGTDDPSVLLQKAMDLQQRGRDAEAIPLYQRCLSRFPRNDTALFNLAVAFHKLGKYRRAVETYRRLLKNDPDRPDVWFNLAAALEASGDDGQAAAAYRKAIELKPGYRAAHFNLGLLLEQAGDPVNAAAALENAVRIDPEDPKAWLRLADILTRLKKHAAARRAYEKVIALDRQCWQAYNNLGNILLIQEDIPNAIKCYEKVVEACPGLAQAHYNLGSALRLAERFGQAEACLKRALEISPAYAEAWNNLALTYKNRGCYSRALECFDKAIDLAPDLAAARWNRAFVRLLKGDFRRGWRDFQWRFKIDRWKTIYPFRLDLPVWDGTNIDGTLFVHDEQGLGDTIQFARYLELARRRCRKLVLETRPELAALLENLPGIDRIVLRPGGSRHPAVAARAAIALMSLPLVFGTGLDSIPARTPYLKASPAKIGQWRQRLGDSGRPRVALVWAGRPRHTNDRNRSLSLEMLWPWLQLDLDFIGLQKGPAAAQAVEISPDRRIANLGPELEDFTDTAAVISLCDLVVTVDTAVAHLAGALGRPVWVLLPFVPDWRWMLERSDSPWYPSMRLYRQPRLRDWHSVIEQVLADLRRKF